MLWDEPKIFFLERRYFFSIILSEFLKNRVALHISAEEAIYRIQEAVQVIRDEITSIADTLTSAVEKFITQVEEAVAQAEPKHRRRKRQRERAALIERRYMVQIRHYERAHPFRRVYKPP